MSSSSARSGPVNDPIRVVIVDDNVHIRSLLKIELSLEDGLELVGEAVAGFQAADVVRSRAADVVVMDVVMPGVDGIEATRQVKAARPEARIVVYSSRPRYEAEEAAYAAGADAYLEKCEDNERVIAVIREVAAR